jgi:hypothetical protein
MSARRRTLKARAERILVARADQERRAEYDARRRVARKLRTPEQPIHEGVVQLLRFTAAPGVVWYAVPNGEYRDVRTIGKLKAQGVRAGVADLAFVLPGGRAAFLEIKASDGRQSDTQLAFEADVAATGALYAVAKSIEQARALLAEWGAIRGAA